MRQLHQPFATLVLLVALCAGAGSAVANSVASKERISGRVTDIDLGSRTMTVREQATRRVIKVRVPEGVRLKTNHHTYTRVGLEQLLPGMVVRDLLVN